ncbi:uncharacterized protein [Apostichopus japonicus]|uniref:uncharacterized protein n=1 Tax=Stichopus japonicus TaxID=307972 RepID=UPI003AB48392
MAKKSERCKQYVFAEYSSERNGVVRSVICSADQDNYYDLNLGQELRFHNHAFSWPFFSQSEPCLSFSLFLLQHQTQTTPVPQETQFPFLSLTLQLFSSHFLYLYAVSLPKCHPSLPSSPSIPSSLPSSSHSTAETPSLVGLETDPDICFVLPYINGLQNLTDDVVITVWLCSFDDESKALKELEHEQYHVGRMKLDSPNTFIILDKDKPITVEITGLQTKNRVQSVSTKRVSEGGHAKVQFVCQLLHRVDENSWIDLDITVKQEEEPNKIQFISRKKVSKLTHIEDLFKKGATELPGADLEGKQEEKKE